MQSFNFKKARAASVLVAAAMVSPYASATSYFSCELPSNGSSCRTETSASLTGAISGTLTITNLNGSTQTARFRRQDGTVILTKSTSSTIATFNFSYLAFSPTKFYFTLNGTPGAGIGASLSL